VARYRVLRWKDIPSLVEAEGAGATVRVPLSARFQDLIDAIAMRDGATESDAYLEGWAQDPDAERAGSPEEVAAAVAAELEEGFQDLVMSRFTGPPGPPAGPPR
jgi:alkanesulfonate monooxygenase SsuD/methylene tetrahydromethanopterin reductase-like flavin-dependent oxidoreductase (luciferase family)